MSYFELEHLTLGEFGTTTTRTIARRFDTRADALSAAIDYAQELAGPIREGYRRPTVSVVSDDTLGMSVKVGSGDVDGVYHLVYAIELGRPVVRPADAGLGYVRSRV